MAETSGPNPHRNDASGRRASAVLWALVALGLGLAPGSTSSGSASSSTASYSMAQPLADASSTKVAGIAVERSSVERDAATSTTLVAAAQDAAPAPTPQVAQPQAASVAASPGPHSALPESELEHERVRRLVLAQISFPWEERLPGWRIEFLPERKGYRGSTFPADRLIQIYLRSDLTTADYVHVVAHEIGHAIDVTLLDDEDHQLWNLARGREFDADWWVASGADDFSSGAGDWAECFAWSQHPKGRFYSEVGPTPSNEQLEIMAAPIG